MKKYIVSILLTVCMLSISARTDVGNTSDKKLDLGQSHNVGNIWLRVSNYGFFGSGYAGSPQWPSLEYPGGSAIDYLFLGSLWFGAKKVRRNSFGEKLYWNSDNPEDEFDVTSEVTEFGLVVDTLVTVGYDGRWDVFEFLPAYNPLENSALEDYEVYNASDETGNSTIRTQRKGIDDDGDGLIDEDPVGYAFPFRESLPDEFDNYENIWLADIDNINPIIDNLDILII